MSEWSPAEATRAVWSCGIRGGLGGRGWGEIWDLTLICRGGKLQGGRRPQGLEVTELSLVERGWGGEESMCV